ncbi:MAG: tRNA uridine(34) 5-carboxymethylaminomethyl modification radical SAM/GNAT enzyme Elp3 [Methanotrichaceae archaeon]|nr:tRNA uridine(34) 5-carboxymethylaminomethyl modification radical SAM/GNAT enzyme Elp3 [Methanotrichaceae archaeon]
MSTELRKIVESLLAGQIENELDLESRKKVVAEYLGLSSLPSNADILSHSEPLERKQLRMLIRKPTRTLSGVAVIAAMTSPARCPQGTCVPCPGGISHFSPQSYTGREPAAMRAEQHDFDPYRQVYARLRQLEEIGHPLDKAELIIMGGTMTARPLGYTVWFIKRCLEAMNDYPRFNPKFNEWKSFWKVAKANEVANVRNIGTTFEIRPDWCRQKHIASILDIGATKVELGVQSLCDEILIKMKRGHTVHDTIEANRALRDAGLKVGFHMMPGLPGSSFEKDLEIFRDLFRDESFRPDYLKIYPTLVIKGTELYDLYIKGEYAPLDDNGAAELVARVKVMLPRYVRLQRVQREIPSFLIEAGAKKSNLRQLAVQRLRDRGLSCHCIRCREAGLKGVLQGNFELMDDVYIACGAEEHFLSFENSENIMVGFLRLRLSKVARVRELHVYGPLVPLRTRDEGWQHRGFGARLVEAAEETARDKGFDNLEINSGIGAREYYRRLGYEFKKPYMAKAL